MCVILCLIPVICSMLCAPLVTMRKMKVQPINAQNKRYISILNLSIKNHKKNQTKKIIYKFFLLKINHLQK